MKATVSVAKGGAGWRAAWLACLVLRAAAAWAAGLELARPFGPHMVVPRERPVPVWGSAVPGSEVAVRFGGQEKRAVAGADGRWRVVLDPLRAAGEGRQLRVAAGGEERVLDDVLVGEVWLCSGQSNMDFPLARAVGGRAEAAGAGDLPSIRLLDLAGVPTGDRPFDAAQRARLTAGRHFEGRWRRAAESSAQGFSAVGWWAGRTIHEASKVPVGLVDNSVGGSGAEAWLPRETLQARAEYAELLGPGWLGSERIGAWARGRARVNLGAHPGDNHPYRPGFLFDSGLRWWGDFPFAGVLWYQGETNAEVRDDAWNERLIRDLVTGWRRVLGQPGLPFVMVQLPRIGGRDPLRRWWPEFRAVQARAAAGLERVRLVVTEDLGWESPDVHQPDKRALGERVGRAALELRAADGARPAQP